MARICRSIFGTLGPKIERASQQQFQGDMRAKVSRSSVDEALNHIDIDTLYDPKTSDRDREKRMPCSC